MPLPFEILVTLVPAVPFVVVPLEPPRVVRPCPRCDRPGPFVSSGAFRVNAQKRRLDVSLVRRCAVCAFTWNQPVHERVSPQSLGDRLEGYHRNDPDLAFQVEHDERALRRFGDVEPASFRVERGPAEPPFAAHVTLERPFSARLDRVLAEGLGLSRSRLRAWVADGLLVTPAPLDRDVRGQAVVWVGARVGGVEAA